MEQRTTTNSDNIKPIIEKSWEEKLSKEFRAEYFKQLKLFLIEEKKKYDSEVVEQYHMDTTHCQH